LALVSLAMGIAGSSMLRASTAARNGSQEERTEKTEDLSVDVRRSSERRSSVVDGRVTIAANDHRQTRCNRLAQTKSRPTDGHRLPNGLLAPLTC
jgi:hypothetical protein